MNTFNSTASALLSRYTNCLLKKQCEEALSGKANGDPTIVEELVDSVISLIDSFADEEYKVRGLYRLSGSLPAQTNALSVIEHARGDQLKHFFIHDLLPVDKANCIKSLLRKMPDTLFPICQRPVFLDLTHDVKNLNQDGDNLKVSSAIQILSYFIPEAHKRCLGKLIWHLKKVDAHSVENKMTMHNLGLIFSCYIFPIPMQGDCGETIRNEIETFCQFFPILLKHSKDLFFISHELLLTLDSNLTLQIKKNKRLNSECTGDSDPEIDLLDSYSDRSTPSTPVRSTTELEMAKLMADVFQMSDGPRKKKLIKKVRHEQRQKLGIQDPSILQKVAKTFSPRTPR